MVDVSAKAGTKRQAVAGALVKMSARTLTAVKKNPKLSELFLRARETLNLGAGAEPSEEPQLEHDPVENGQGGQAAAISVLAPKGLEVGRVGAYDRPHWRRDGGLDRFSGSRADRLRHVQSGRQGNRDHRPAAARKKRRQERPVSGSGSDARNSEFESRNSKVETRKSSHATLGLPGFAGWRRR